MMQETVKKCACQGGTLMRFVQPIVLAELQKESDHGYSILQKISKNALWAGEMPDSAGLYRVLRDMERRGLIESHIDTDSRAGMGKRVFTITEEGRGCMVHWLDTLVQYRRGIDETITLLRDTLKNG